MINRKFSFAFLTMAFAAALGCASLPAEVERPTPQEVTSSTADLRGPIPDFDMLGITPEMRAFVERHVPAYGFGEERLGRLFRALNDPEDLRIEYDASASLTAQEVFEQRRANCLSFAALFVTLAREAGFRASFQEVDIPPTWIREEDVLLRYLHVNTSVDLTARRRYVAEFREDRFDEHMLRRLITDTHALALHYNNVGATWLVNGDLDKAGAYFVRAVDTFPKLAIGWINLGVVHRRQGNEDLAEISYRQALAVNPRSFSAMSNLATIYAGRGRTELARELNDLALSERRKNPHYYYILAQRAYSRQDYREARSQLKAALRRDRNEHRFHYLMALTLRELGQLEKAEESLRQAERKAVKKKDKKRYDDILNSWATASLQQ